MLKKTSLLVLFSLFAASLLLVSCGGKSGSNSGKAPEVVTNPGSNPVDGNTDASSNTGDNLTQTTPPSVTINPSGGDLTINGESVHPSDYNSSNASAKINANDGTGDCVVTVSDDGIITIIPADGSLAGTYTVTIDTGEREYILIIEVNADGDSVVITSISNPSGSSMILDLDDGKFTNTLTGKEIVISEDGLFSGYELIADIKVTGTGGNITVVVDSVTGDIVASGDHSGPYTIVITTADGSVITLTTDSTGKITGIVENNSTLILNLDNGAVSSSGYNLTLTNSISGEGWSLAPGVEVIGVTAAGGVITSINTERVWVNQNTGNIMITGIDGVEPPVGPYEIKVSVGNSVYVIKTDVSGQVISILPGNVLLELTQGVMTYSDNNVLTLAVNNNGWTLSGSISGLTAVGASGNTLNISVDPNTGNFVTDQNITGTVVITFLYTDSNGNGITYTIIVINGSVNSYTAEITNPSSDFDFSTVTNIKVFLNVVDSTTGSPVKQASISLANATAEQSWKGFTDDQGVSVFTATVTAASQTTSIAVAHAGYENIESPITGIGKLIEIGKKIAMTPKSVVIPPVDNDNDGVLEGDDADDNDANVAKILTGSFTFGFEDQYAYDKVVFNSLNRSGMPTGNDADFNDLVVRLSVEEKIDSQNRITRITLKAKAVAALSGGNNSFGIYVNGQKYIMIPKSQISGRNPYCVLAPEVTLEIPFAGGIARNTIGAMPYDPFMVPNGGNAGTDGISQVHLLSANTTYTGVRKGNGYIKTSASTCVPINNFVWALIIPENWQWPNEGTCIAIAYPKFVNWCNTGGNLDIQWYNFSTTGNVVPRQ